MSPLSEYLDGIVRVPLRLLTSDGFSECPARFSATAAKAEFYEFLRSQATPISGIVTPTAMLDMLRVMGVTLARFRRTLNPQEAPLVNNSAKVTCLVGPQCLAQARAALGEDFECMVRIYCLPPEIPGQFSDGEICRQLLLASDNPEIGEKWLGRLSRGKQRHIKMLRDRIAIWKAMEKVAHFSGLWEGIQIGNFAKHLAAHCDDAIVRYWEHINKTWSAIFKGLESQIILLDSESVRRLQYMAPSRCEKDRRSIQKQLEAKTLFPEIWNEDHRAMLYPNIISLDIVIPSLLTFHENFRYITIGTKILERTILAERKRHHLSPTRRKPFCLQTKLAEIWKPRSAVTTEIRQGEFDRAWRCPSPQCAFIIILLCALRDFPFLGFEAPFQDTKSIGMAASPCNRNIARLCHIASAEGFINQRIKAGLTLTMSTMAHIPEPPQQLLARWRGGKPSIETFWELQRKGSPSYLAHGESQGETALGTSPAWVLKDMLNAFFGNVLENLPANSTEPSLSSSILNVPGQDIHMPGQDINLLDQDDNMLDQDTLRNEPDDLSSGESMILDAEERGIARSKRRVRKGVEPKSVTNARRRATEIPFLNKAGQSKTSQLKISRHKMSRSATSKTQPNRLKVSAPKELPPIRPQPQPEAARNQPTESQVESTLQHTLMFDPSVPHRTSSLVPMIGPAITIEPAPPMPEMLPGEQLQLPDLFSQSQGLFTPDDFDEDGDDPTVPQVNEDTRRLPQDEEL